MTYKTAFAAVLAASLLAAGAASAGGDSAAKPRVACAADIQKFCPTAAPGKEAKRCLKSHMAEASSGCQSAVQEAKAMHAQKKAAAAAATPEASTAPPAPQ